MTYQPIRVLMWHWHIVTGEILKCKVFLVKCGWENKVYFCQQQTVSWSLMLLMFRVCRWYLTWWPVCGSQSAACEWRSRLLLMFPSVTLSERFLTNDRMSGEKAECEWYDNDDDGDDRYTPEQVFILTGLSNTMTSHRTSATSGSVYGGRQKQHECISWVTSCWPCCSMAWPISCFLTSKSSSCCRNKTRMFKACTDRTHMFNACTDRGDTCLLLLQSSQFKQT